MHLVVDGQCLQTDSLQRGIGRYSLRLLQSMAQVEPTWRFSLLLNRVAAPVWTTHLERIAREDMPGNIHISYFDSPSTRMIQFKGGRRIANECRESHINGLKPDAVLILSAFQRRRETVLAPRGERTIPTAAILYDLIPLHYPQHFLYAPSLRRDYAERLAVLKDCDLLLSISRASAKDWTERVGRQPPVVTIGGGCEPAIESDQQLTAPQRSGVLCIGAETPNKNIETLLDAFAKVPGHLQAANPLTIVGIRQPAFARYLHSRYRGRPETLRIPGYLSEGSLNELLESSRVVVSPSVVEGLGLAAYEAARYGTPSLVSAPTSQSEFVTDPRAQFPPHDAAILMSRLAAILESDQLWEQLSVEAITSVVTHSWLTVASLATARLRDARDAQLQIGRSLPND